MKPKAAQMRASASTERVQSEPAEFVFNLGRDSDHSPLLFPSSASAKMPTRTANVAHRKQPESVKIALENKLLVSRGEAAQLLSISERGIDYLIAARRLPTKRIGGRVLIPVADLKKYARCDHPERIVS